MRQRFKSKVQPVFYESALEKVGPPGTVPVVMDNSQIINMYRQNCKLMDRYSDYAHQLEEKYTELYLAHLEMKKQYGVMKDFFKHPNSAQLKECEIMLEKQKLIEKISKPKHIFNLSPEEDRLFKSYKSAIRGQYYYIAYLKAVLHNHNVEYKKKPSFNTVELTEIDDLIQKIISEKE